MLVRMVKEQKRTLLKAAAIETLGYIDPGTTPEAVQILLDTIPPSPDLWGNLAERAFYRIDPKDRVVLRPLFAFLKEPDRGLIGSEVNQSEQKINLAFTVLIRLAPGLAEADAKPLRA